MRAGRHCKGGVQTLHTIKIIKKKKIPSILLL